MATNPYQTQLDDITTGSQFTPTTTAFDESKGVAGRVDSITSKDSPLMQRAATRAQQGMNARGLTNSSIAIGAGQSAVIDAATPIANADANLFQQQGLANQTSLNDAARANAAARTTVGLKGLDLAESGRQFDTNDASTNARFNKELTETTRQFDTSQAGTNTRFDKELTENSRQFDTNQANTKTRAADARSHDIVMAGLDKSTRLAVMDAESKFRSDIAGNENISNAWGTTMAAIDKVQNNPDLDDATKQTMIDNAIGSFGAFSSFWKKASGGAVDVSDLLVFTQPSAAAATPAPAAAPAAPAAAPAAATTAAPRGSLSGIAAKAREEAAATASVQQTMDDYNTYLRQNGGGA